MDRGIIFTQENRQSVRDGSKTQTRRVIKWPKDWSDFVCHHITPLEDGRFSFWADDGSSFIQRCPYGKVGDRLYVREAFAQCGTVMAERIAYIAYKADNPLLGATSRMKCCDVPKGKPFLKTIRKYRSSIHMPKWAARDWLDITGIRAELLQDISEDDCIAEGIKYKLNHGIGGETCYDDVTGKHKGEYRWLNPKGPFSLLWDSINATPKPVKANPYTGKRELCKVAYPWEDVREEIVINTKTSKFYGCKVYIVGNPWVWPIEFRKA